LNEQNTPVIGEQESLLLRPQLASGKERERRQEQREQNERSSDAARAPRLGLVLLC
jgi:hypothetical protein